MGAGQPKPIKPSNEFVSAPTNINRPTGEINVKEEHNNYPAFISFNGDENYDEARFSLWTIVAAIGATLFLVYIIKRIWDCRRKSIAKKEEKAAKKEEKAKDAEKARDSRLEALAMTPIKWNNDRFEEITEKINQVQKIVEVIPSAGTKALPEPTVATPQVIMASPYATPFNDPIAQMPPVTFNDQIGPFARMPALTFIDNGRARRNRGRR